MINSGEYIQHHLQHLMFNLYDFKFYIQNNLYNINLDTMIISWLLALIFISFFYFSLKKDVFYNISKTQNIVEYIFELIINICKDNNVNEKYHKLIVSTGVSVFVWILLMNITDMIPVDLFPIIFSTLFGHNFSYFKSVPTADPYTTFALSIGIFIISIYCNLKFKGIKELIHEICLTPFGKYLLILNIIFHLIEAFVKIFSLSLRLFGNLFAGEIIFILISALLPWYIQWTPGIIWSLLHMLIIGIQAYIFMFLTVIYLSMSIEHKH
jgi:F-type H+-transporting ATPase subunit a